MHRKRYWTVLLGVMLCATAVMAKDKDKKNTGGVEQQIAALEDQGRDEKLKGDTRFAEQYYADDYVGIGGRGVMEDKSKVINSYKGDLKFTAIDYADRKVRVLGDTAIVNGTATMKGTFQGQSLDGTYRYTRVWMKRGGKWQIVNFQCTPVKSGR